MYLADDLAEAVRGSGVPLAELVRRGLNAVPVNERLARRVSEETAAAVAGELRDLVRSEVRSALAQAQGSFS